VIVASSSKLVQSIRVICCGECEPMMRVWGQIPERGSPSERSGPGSGLQPLKLMSEADGVRCCFVLGAHIFCALLEPVGVLI